MQKLEEDMKPKLIGETWRKYPTETSTQKATYGLFECQYCRKEFECQVSDVKRGRTKSCGCLLGIKHGLTNSRFYKTWKGMLQRCTNPNHKAYKDYGARGIAVCEEWQDVTNFVAWAESTHPNMEGYTLDRIDNDKGYSPENCTWSDKTTQAINQRIMKNNKSGYVGIYYKSNKKWGANIRINKILKQIGSIKTKEEAVQARDNYIIENNLPHKLST
mgnify:CR=1 FL=1